MHVRSVHSIHHTAQHAHNILSCTTNTTCMLAAGYIAAAAKDTSLAMTRDNACTGALRRGGEDHMQKINGIQIPCMRIAVLSMFLSICMYPGGRGVGATIYKHSNDWQ